MPYVIAKPCTKDADCVQVCPVDCIHPRPDEPEFSRAEQLYIDAESCIHCDSCFRVCTSNAIFSREGLPPEWRGYASKNAAYYAELEVLQPR